MQSLLVTAEVPVPLCALSEREVPGYRMPLSSRSRWHHPLAAALPDRIRHNVTLFLKVVPVGVYRAPSRTPRSFSPGPRIRKCEFRSRCDAERPGSHSQAPRSSARLAGRLLRRHSRALPSVSVSAAWPPGVENTVVGPQGSVRQTTARAGEEQSLRGGNQSRH